MLFYVPFGFVSFSIGKCEKFGKELSMEWVIADVIWMRINYGLDVSEDANENLVKKHTLTKNTVNWCTCFVILVVFRLTAKMNNGSSGQRTHYIVWTRYFPPILSLSLSHFFSHCLALRNFNFLMPYLIASASFRTRQ